MSMDEWSPEQREALRRWASQDDSERHPHDLLPGGRKSDQEVENNGKPGNGSNDVQPEQCAEMRRKFKQNDDLTIKSMAEDHFDYHRSTIAEHVFGRRCNHNIDEEPAESPMGDIDSGNFIQPDECAEMRQFWDEKREIVTVQEEFGKTYGQTYHHLVGRCKCDHDIPDIKTMKMG